jgi:hypothetical protein
MTSSGTATAELLIGRIRGCHGIEDLDAVEASIAQDLCRLSAKDPAAADRVEKSCWARRQNIWRCFLQQDGDPPASNQ